MINFFLSLAQNSQSNKIVLADTDLVITFDGDSLTHGINNAGIDQYYPKQVQAWLIGKAKSLVFNSFGVSGQTTQQMLSDAVTQIDPLVNVNKTNIIVAWEDVNAILNNSRTAQQNFDDFKTYFSGRKAAGYDYGILLLGYYPRTPYNNVLWDSGSPTPLSIQKDYFDLVIANSVDWTWDYTIDLRNETNIGGAEAQAVDGVYFNDSVHLNAIGYDDVAQSVIDKGLLQIFQL